MRLVGCFLHHSNGKKPAPPGPLAPHRRQVSSETEQAAAKPKCLGIVGCWAQQGAVAACHSPYPTPNGDDCPVSVLLSSTSCDNAKLTETIPSPFVSRE